eukprot:TRINITY_DN643_c1_g2_i3.p1 TRINITY_DN643_c1_g2~~TRINITY_DN643_c1_g2_i3.p1  ORF type:complete len:168 (-),score=28.51 TRINITY_DN643_c1_g2_i3:1228-1731(-)
MASVLMSAAFTATALNLNMRFSAGWPQHVPGLLLSALVLSYNDTMPHGIVENTVEFAKICRESTYHNPISFANTSTPVVLVEAYRLLAVQQYPACVALYPLHLGITRDRGEDNCMKSAIGIAMACCCRFHAAMVCGHQLVTDFWGRQPSCNHQHKQMLCLMGAVLPL